MTSQFPLETVGEGLCRIEMHTKSVRENENEIYTFMNSVCVSARAQADYG